jgi:hypothetical protein
VAEHLQAPTSVSFMAADGLHLDDGRFVEWGVGAPVPTDLAAIRALVDHGVEVASDGRAIGLVDVWHWCGNDSIHNHLARVDIGSVLEFLGGRRAPGADQPLTFEGVDAQFTERGWNVSSWRAFERWHGADPDRIYR